MSHSARAGWPKQGLAGYSFNQARRLSVLCKKEGIEYLDGLIRIEGWVYDPLYPFISTAIASWSFGGQTKSRGLCQISVCLFYPCSFVSVQYKAYLLKNGQMLLPSLVEVYLSLFFFFKEKMMKNLEWPVHVNHMFYFWCKIVLVKFFWWKDLNAEKRIFWRSWRLWKRMACPSGLYTCSVVQLFM